MRVAPNGTVAEITGSNVVVASDCLRLTRPGQEGPINAASLNSRSFIAFLGDCGMFSERKIHIVTLFTTPFQVARMRFGGKKGDN